MNRQPAAAKIERNAVKIYDQSGAYMNSVSFGSEKVTGATVKGNTLAVSFDSGQLRAYTVGQGHSPIYRFTR